MYEQKEKNPPKKIFKKKIIIICSVVAEIAGQARDQTKGQRSNSGARFLCEQHITLVSLHTPATPPERDPQEDDLF
jgi:hypothetical protein